MSIFIIGLLSTIGVRWRSLALMRWSSSISWEVWDMLIFGAIKGIVRIMVTIKLLTSLVTKVVDGLLPWRRRRRVLMDRCHDNALSAVHHYVAVGVHHHHHALRDALGEELALESAPLHHFEDDGSPLDVCAHCGQRLAQYVLGAVVEVHPLVPREHHQCGLRDEDDVDLHLGYVDGVLDCHHC